MTMKPNNLATLRLSPLNRIAALKLKGVKIGEHHEELPVFQLMNWGLSAGVRLAHRRTARELLHLCNMSDQNQAYAYLIANVPGGLLRFEKLLLKLSPHSAAEALLDLLDMQLKADPHNPYPEGGI
jgi:hypothetical protein